MERSKPFIHVDVRQVDADGVAYGLVDYAMGHVMPRDDTDPVPWRRDALIVQGAEDRRPLRVDPWRVREAAQHLDEASTCKRLTAIRDLALHLERDLEIYFHNATEPPPPMRPLDTFHTRPSALM